MPPSEAPATTGIHHFSPTVSDVERSAEWYVRVFGLERLPRLAPHHGDEDGGYAVLLVDPRTGLLIGLHHHVGALAGAFDERRVGLDHLAWGVEDRAGLEAWAGWLDGLGISHSGIIDKQGASTYSAIVFRDPDNIQLELFLRG
jgi:glyoxylase I family protein